MNQLEVLAILSSGKRTSTQDSLEEKGDKRKSRLTFVFTPFDVVWGEGKLSTRPASSEHARKNLAKTGTFV